jgi:hypothetical protein
MGFRGVCCRYANTTGIRPSWMVLDLAPAIGKTIETRKSYPHLDVLGSVRVDLAGQCGLSEAAGTADHGRASVLRLWATACLASPRHELRERYGLCAFRRGDGGRRSPHLRLLFGMHRPSGEPWMAHSLPTGLSNRAASALPTAGLPHAAARCHLRQAALHRGSATLVVSD